MKYVKLNGKDGPEIVEDIKPDVWVCVRVTPESVTWVLPRSKTDLCVVCGARVWYDPLATPHVPTPKWCMECFADTALSTKH